MESLGKNKYNNTLFTKTRKLFRAKCGGYRKISYIKEFYYKLYLELCSKYVEKEEASFIIDILFILFSD